ncbi:hypothetical protein D9M69_480640 [compost metagenome]
MLRVMAVQDGEFAEADLLQQQPVEARLQRAHRNEAAIGATIGGVPVGPVEHAVAALLGHLAVGLGAEQQVLHMGAAVDYRRIDHLALPRGAGMHQCGQQADGQIERPTADIAHQAGRRQRRLARLAGVPEGAGQGDVIEVVAGGLGQRPLLAPAGHAAIDQPGIERQAHVRPQAQALHDAGAHAFDQRIAVLRQLQHGANALGTLQVDADGALAALVERAGPHIDFFARLFAALHQHHIGAEVGEQHAAERPRPQASDFQHLQTGQRPLSTSHFDSLRQCRSTTLGSSEDGRLPLPTRGTAEGVRKSGHACAPRTWRHSGWKHPA